MNLRRRSATRSRRPWARARIRSVGAGAVMQFLKKFSWRGGWPAENRVHGTHPKALTGTKNSCESRALCAKM